jgi:cytochrome P450
VTATEPAIDILGRWGAFDQETVDDPYPLYARLAAEGPVHRVTLGDGRPAWIVTGFDEARAVLLDQRLIKDTTVAAERYPGLVPEGFLHPLLQRHMLSADPPDHTRLRRLASSAFTNSRVEALRARVEALVDELLDGLSADEPVDIVARFALPLPFTVICELLGVPEELRAEIHTHFRRMLSTPYVPGGDEEGKAAADRLAELFVEIHARHRAAPGDDLISALVTACDEDGRLDDGELLSLTWLLFIAGHDTTVNLIANGAVALARHPEVAERLAADPSLVPAAVEEFLRYDAPVNHTTFRCTVEPTEVGGVTIPAGELVLVVLAAADRDPRHFPEPDRLDIDRAGQHIAFGHGIHFCLGAPLARLEGQVAFARLLERFDRIELAGQPHWTNNLVLRGCKALPVVLRRNA